MGTRQFLLDHIDNVFDDFVNSQPWCDVNGFQLNGDSYRVTSNQQKYIIKYFAAYFCEYYDAFDDLFKKYKPESLNVLSIGCGSGIDYYALKRYIEDKRIEVDIDYLGIDIVDWKYKPTCNGFEFKHIGIDDLEPEDVEDINLVVGLPRVC